MLVSAGTYLDALFLLLGDNSSRSKELVREFIDTQERLSNKKEILSGDDELVDVYKSLIKTVISENVSQENQTASKILLLKIKTNETIKSHPLIRDLLTDVLSAQEPISDSQINEYTKRLRNVLLQAELDAVTRKIFAKNRVIADIVDVDEQEIELNKVRQLIDDGLKSIDNRRIVADTKASESYVSLSDKESLLRSLNVFVDRSVRGIIRTGLQGLNRALGKRGGFGLGEAVVFAASSHNFKSGMLVCIMIWTIVYNKIIVRPGKKALVYFVSLENEVHQNLMDVFTILYGRVEKKPIDLEVHTVEFIQNWLHNYFSQFDVECIIDRYSPHEFSYRKFFQRFTAFEELGYELILFDLDYLSEARGVDPGDTISTQGSIQLIKENYTKFTNHAKACGYLFATGHQLTKKAEEIARDHRYSVKKFNPSLMADSSDVHRIVDILFFMQLDYNVDGHKFLTVQNRKNRGSKDTPERDKFFAYPFTEFGIEDDIDGIPQYITDIDSWGSSQGTYDSAVVESSVF